MPSFIKTYSPKASEVKHDWYVIDAKGQNLGRVASEAARLLRGKHKPTYTPHMDMGDYVIIINAAEITVTGNRLNDKIYYRHTMYPGGLRAINLRDQLAKFPERPLEAAIKGMLPHNKLGRAMYKKLKVYAGAEHPAHSSPKPMSSIPRRPRVN
jgi:large subunit ribosomal protein L13